MKLFCLTHLIDEINVSLLKEQYQYLVKYELKSKHPLECCLCCVDSVSRLTNIMIFNIISEPLIALSNTQCRHM